MSDSRPPERDPSDGRGRFDDAPGDAPGDPLEQALRAQEPYPVPLGLVSSVLAAVRAEPRHGAHGDVVRPIRAPRLGWAVAAILLLAVSAYLTLGGTDLLAAVSPFSDDASVAGAMRFRVGLSGGTTGLDGVALVGVEDAVKAGVDHVVGGVAAVADASDAGAREPLVWAPVAIVFLLAGLALSHRIGRRAAGRTPALPFLS